MIGPERPVVHRDGQRFVLSISSFGGLAVRGEAACELDEARGELRWTMKIGNDAPGTVVGVIGPCLRNVQDLPGGVLAIPNRPGHRIRDPWKTLAASVQHLEYPVPASMQYMAYSSSIGGIAVHVLDREMVYKQLAFGGAGRQMTFIQYPFVAHGGQWTSPSVVWQVLSQDWHQAADRYRAWFRSWAEKPQVSRRLRSMPVVPSMVIRARPKDDPVLKDVLKSMELRTYEAGLARVPEYSQAGFDGVHLVGWFGQGHDTTYPDHEPGAEMGGEDGLLKLAAGLRANRLLAVYYLNARLLNVTSKSYRLHPEWGSVSRKTVRGGNRYRRRSSTWLAPPRPAISVTWRTKCSVLPRATAATACSSTRSARHGPCCASTSPTATALRPRPGLRGTRTCSRRSAVPCAR